MSDIVKWSILGAVLVALVGLIIGLGVTDRLGAVVTQLVDVLGDFITAASTAFKFARGLLNNLTGVPVVVSIVLYWTLFSRLLKYPIRLTARAAKWIFK